jgi:biopolymer transport protein ExbB
MNTTAFGLMAAIPLLLIHSHLQGKANEIVENLEIAVVKFLNFMERNRQRLLNLPRPPLLRRRSHLQLNL